MGVLCANDRVLPRSSKSLNCVEDCGLPKHERDQYIEGLHLVLDEGRSDVAFS